MASLDPYHLGLVLAVLWHTGWGSGPTGIPQSFDTGSSILGRLGWRVLVMTEDSRLISISHSDRNGRRVSGWSQVAITKMQRRLFGLRNRAGPSALGLPESTVDVIEAIARRLA